jgi:hypothetical protein
MDTATHARRHRGWMRERPERLLQARRPYLSEGGARAEVGLWEFQYGGGITYHEEALHLDADPLPENGVGICCRHLTHKQLVILQAIFDDSNTDLLY